MEWASGDNRKNRMGERIVLTPIRSHGRSDGGKERRETLLGQCLVIFLSPGVLCSDTIALLLIAQSGVIQRSVKEVIKHL